VICVLEIFYGVGLFLRLFVRVTAIVGVEFMRDGIRVAGIAVRTARRGAMGVLDEVVVEVSGGLIGDMPKKSFERGLTFLSRAQWDAVNAELGSDLVWHTRRANVLVEGMGSLAKWIGRRIRIGELVEIEISGETRPCGLMEYLKPGLEGALESECRGGVHGRVIRGGRFRVGDLIAEVATEEEK